MLHAERAVARTKTLLAGRTVVVGPLQRQIPKHAGECFFTPVDIACGLSAGAGSLWPGVVRDVGIETLLEGSCRDLKNGAAEMHFGGFKIELVHAHTVYKRLDFLEGGGPELRLDLRLEPPFLAASCQAASRSSSSLSAACSQRFQKASTWLRNCCPRSI